MRLEIARNNELNQKEQIQLRYHHLGNLITISNLNKEGAKDFSELYLHDNIASSFIDALVNRDLEEIDNILSSKSNNNNSLYSLLPIEYAEDFIGKNGSEKDAHSKSLRQAYATLLQSKPEVDVSLSNKPDILCKTCQINGFGQPGLHCIVKLPDDINSNTDLIYKKALRGLLLDEGVPAEIRNSFNSYEKDGDLSYTTKIGTLRSKIFLDKLEELRDSVWLRLN